jgi:hypothetical protein
MMPFSFRYLAALFCVLSSCGAGGRRDNGKTVPTDLQ